MTTFLALWERIDAWPYLVGMLAAGLFSGTAIYRTWPTTQRPGLIAIRLFASGTLVQLARAGASFYITGDPSSGLASLFWEPHWLLFALAALVSMHLFGRPTE